LLFYLFILYKKKKNKDKHNILKRIIIKSLYKMFKDKTSKKRLNNTENYKDKCTLDTMHHNISQKNIMNILLT